MAAQIAQIALPFQVATGILLAGLVILLIRSGMSIHRSNSGVRSAIGAIIFVAGMALGWATMILAFPP